MKKTLLFLLLFSQIQAQTFHFPLKSSLDKRYIVDQLNQPVFLNGCASWRLTYHIAYPDVKKYLADRQKRGFNTLILEITPDYMLNKGGNYPDINGEYVFQDGDIGKPNEKFFAHIDSVLQLCSDMHFVVLLFPLYLGCCRDGWLELLQQAPNTVEKCRDYGKWIADRYGKFSNIVWVSGGDHNETPESLAFAEGLAARDSSHLHAYHGNPGYTSLERVPAAKWLTLDCIYTYFPAMNRGQYQVYAQFFMETLRERQMPRIMSESAYEYERNETTQTLRRQAYWALLSGASGHIFGNRDTWMMNENWKNALNTPGNLSMEIFYSLVKVIPWQELEPDWTHTLFTGGRGQFNGTAFPGGEDYATAAFSRDSTLGILYMPSYRKVSVNMDRFPSEVRVSWFDPTNGKYIALPGQFPNRGLRFFSPPNLLNSKGFDDWVLLIRTTKK